MNLVLKRASASRSSGEWSDDDYDVLADGVVVGRIMKAAATDASWLWTLAYGQHEDRTPTHGYEATREAAMAAFAKSWRREGSCACSMVLGCKSGRRAGAPPPAESERCTEATKAL